MAYIWLDAARYDSACRECEDTVREGDRCLFDSDRRLIYCEPCGEEMAAKPIRTHTKAKLRGDGN